MFFLAFLPPRSVLAAVLLGALWLIVLTLPVAYPWVFRPGVLHRSKRARADAASQESAARCRQATEVIHEVFWLSSAASYKIIYISPEYEKVWGRTCESLYQDPASFLDSIYAEDRERISTALKQRLGEFAEEYRIVRPTGEVRWIRARAFPVRNECGEVYRIVEFAEDITECKQAEDMLLTYQVQQQSLLSELLRTKERERQALAIELHDSVGQVLAIAKFKLDALRGVASASGHVSAFDDVYDLLSQGIQQTRSLIFELSPPVLYQVGLVAAVESLAQHTRERYGLCVEVSHDDEYQTLPEDMQIQLFRAVQELLINVVKHAQARHVQISISRDGDYIRITVADDGVGFDLSRRRSHEALVSGFGLFSISKRLQSLHGYYDIDSQPGHGTQVTLMALLQCANDILAGESA